MNGTSEFSQYCQRLPTIGPTVSPQMRRGIVMVGRLAMPGAASICRNSSSFLICASYTVHDLEPASKSQFLCYIWPKSDRSLFLSKRTFFGQGGHPNFGQAGSGSLLGTHCSKGPLMASLRGRGKGIRVFSTRTGCLGVIAPNLGRFSHPGAPGFFKSAVSAIKSSAISTN